MRTPVLLTALLATTLTLSPLIGATSEGCAVQSDPNAINIADHYYVKAVPQLPVQASKVSLWSETNDLPGLQTSPTPCGYGQPMIPQDIAVITISGVIPL